LDEVAAMLGLFEDAARETRGSSWIEREGERMVNVWGSILDLALKLTLNTDCFNFLHFMYGKRRSKKRARIHHQPTSQQD
jgi:hypothetical protein